MPSAAFVPGPDMLVHRLLEDAARRTPDAVALIEPGATTSYGALDRAANRFAHLFQAAGVIRGERIVIALDNGAEMAAAYLGALKAGGVAVPLPAGPRSDRFAHAVADCAPRVCIVDLATARDAAAAAALVPVPAVFVAGRRNAALAPALLDLAPALANCPDTPLVVRSIDLDLAAIIYTSGSTGDPRGVMLTHRNFIANARSIVSYLRLTAADRVMCVLPFHYVYGLSLLHTHLMVGGSVVIDNRFTFPNVVLAAMQQHQVTGFAGVPSTFAFLLHRSNLQDVELPGLRYVTQAGGNMPAPRILEWLERGPRAAFYVMYGATEAAARLTYLDPQDLTRKLGSIGRPVPNVEIQVVTEAGKPAVAGEVGELIARGSNISCGYWNSPEESRERFGALGYRTGDLGYADDEGFLFLIGRRHDMIKVGAHRVGAKEIEDVLHEHPSVREAVVVGAPHPMLGETPVAFVTLREGAADAAAVLRAFCSTRLPPHKVPQRISVEAELPRLAGSGKTDKPFLRRAASQHGL
jgi:amino acid adenylation domain-containing protein